MTTDKIKNLAFGIMVGLAVGTFVGLSIKSDWYSIQVNRILYENLKAGKSICAEPEVNDV